MAKASRSPTFTQAATRTAAKKAGQAGVKAAAKHGNSHRATYGPYALSAGLTLVAWRSAGATVPGWHGPAVVAGALLLAALLVAVCQAKGHPLGGIDRSEEVVYVAALLAVAAGWTASVGLDRWWGGSATVSAATAALAYWTAVLRLGLPRWAGGVAAVLVLVVAVTVLAPLRQQVDGWRWLAAWAGGTTLAATPWWQHRGVRRGVHVDRTVGAWLRAATEQGHDGLKVVGPRQAFEAGWRALAHLPNGQTWEDLAATVRKQESAANLRRGSLSVEPDPQERAHMAIVQCVERDMHADAQDWRGPTGLTAADPLTIGPRADGPPAQIVLYDQDGSRAVLVVGKKGAGKSTALNVLLGELAPRIDVLPVGVDMKGQGVEFGPWADGGAMPLMAGTLVEARALLVALLAVVNGRGTLLRQRGRKKWYPGPSWSDGSLVDGQPQDGPLVVLVIDEAHQCLGVDHLCAELALQVLQLGRYAAVAEIICTQVPKQQSLGDASIRGQIDVTIIFKLRRPQDAAFALEGNEHLDLEPWQFSDRRKGTCFVLGAEDERDTVRARSYRMSDEQVETVAAARAGLGVVLDAATVAAALAALPQVLAGSDLRLPEEEQQAVEAAAAAMLTRAASSPATDPARRPANQLPATPSNAPAATPGGTMAGGGTSRHRDRQEDAMQHDTTPDATQEVRGEDGRTPTEREMDRLATLPLPRGTDLPAAVQPREGRPDLLVEDLPRVSTSRAVEEMYALASRPDGVSRVELVAATGWQKSFWSARLSAALVEGKLEQFEHGRYRATRRLHSVEAGV